MSWQIPGSGHFPLDFHDTSTTFPGTFPGSWLDCSRTFLRVFQNISREFPGNAQDISKTFSGHLQENSITFPGANIPGNIPEISTKYSGHLWECSETFPGLFDDISKNTLRHFREISSTCPRNFRDTSRTFSRHLDEISGRFFREMSRNFHDISFGNRSGFLAPTRPGFFDTPPDHGFWIRKPRNICKNNGKTKKTIDKYPQTLSLLEFLCCVMFCMFCYLQWFCYVLPRFAMFLLKF